METNAIAAGNPAMSSSKTGSFPPLPEPAQIKPFFENLDTLRFFSFMVVFLFHTHFYEFVASHTGNTVVLSIVRLMSSGGWGVCFFFALSGFLITWLLLVEKQKKDHIHLGAFYLRRIFRIWPLYYLVFFIGTVILPLGYKYLGQKFYFDYPPGLFGTFLSNYGVAQLDPALNNVRSYPLVMDISWSVSIEEQFYVFWPLLFMLKNKLARFVAPAFIIISLISAFIFRNNGPQIYENTLVRIGEIAIGGAFAYAAYFQKPFFERILNLPRGLIITLYLLASAIVLVSFQPGVTLLDEYFLRMAGTCLFALIILEQNFSKRSFFKFGRLKVFGYLGKVSYGLYLLHPLAMFGTSIILQRSTGAVRPVNEGGMFILISFVAAVTMAVCSYKLLEQPFLRLKKRFEIDRLAKNS